jgi:hypothetical protein
MPTTKSHRNESHARHRTPRAEKPLESPQEITHDIVDYLSDYAKEHPGYAALVCIGVGFVLGWKLKPW